MESLRPNLQRAKNAKIFVYISMAMGIGMLISMYLQSELLAKAARGEFVTVEDVNSNDQRHVLVSSLYIIVYIISAITFIQWFRRAYFNLHLKTKNLSSSEGWAAGCWFVPVLNLFKPY
ncbi:MAG: DUF4328 domain-containing protein [Bacteroidales bacterium]|nr:DUF4328 domain-containing protein [Bacteroidales bacterium]